MADDLSIAEILYQNFVSEGPSATVMKKNSGSAWSRRRRKSDDLGVLDFVDRNLTGKEPNYENPGLPTFVAGYLRQILFSHTFSKLASEVREKIQFLSFLMHITERADGDFHPAYSYYLSLEEELANGKATWRDSLGPVIVDIIERTLEAESGRTGGSGGGSNSPADSTAAMPTVKFECLDEDDNASGGQLLPPEDQKLAADYDDVKKQEGEGTLTKMEVEDNTWPDGDNGSGGKVKKKRGPKKKAKTIAATPAAAATGPVTPRRRGRPRRDLTNTDPEPTELVNCEKCPYRLQSLEDLDRHLFKIHGDGRLCPTCGHGSNTFEEYELHMEMHSITCNKEDCTEVFTSMKALREHISASHQKKEDPSTLKREPNVLVECPVCRMKTSRLVYHLTVCKGAKRSAGSGAPRPAKKKYLCRAPGCTKQYVSQKRLRSHMVRDHDEPDNGSGDDDYQYREEEDSDDEERILQQQSNCHLCRMRTTALDRHLYEIHGHGVVCEQCGHKTDGFKEYEEHMEIHEVTCPHCGKEVLGIRGLRTHIRVDHLKGPENEEKVACDLCGKTMKPASLMGHIRLTHGEADIACSKCDFKTNRQDSLRRHWRIRHTETWEQCPVCGKKLKVKLKRHLKICGKEREKTVPCDVCFKKFSCKERMRAHKRKLHSGKHHACEMCDYRTYSSFNLRLHLSKMHNAPSLQATCPVCEIKTHSLDWHIKVFHPVHFDEQQDGMEIGLGGGGGGGVLGSGGVPTNLSSTDPRTHLSSTDPHTRPPPPLIANMSME